MAEKTKSATAAKSASSAKVAAQSSGAAAAAKPAPAPAAKPAVVPVKPVSAGERSRMIAEAAYFIAQRRGFTPGNDVQDWLTAEKVVDAQLRGR